MAKRAAGHASDDSVSPYLATVAPSKPLTPERERLLVRRIAAGEKALCELVEAHLPLVARLAKRKASPGNHVLDLIQAGNDGLLQASCTWVASSGKPFTPYARKLILEAIDRRLAPPTPAEP